MRRYKVGDKVRVIATHGCRAGKKGEVLTINSVGGYLPGDRELRFEESRGYCYESGDHLELCEKTLDNLVVGDILIDDDGDECKVIDVLPNSVLLSDHRNHDQAFSFYSIAELEADGWTVKQDSPIEAVTELSVADIEEKLGLESGTLRVKKDD
ncbi:hypothetical protein [Rhodococcus sp. HS-D2]|uniref:hypothetical protein n=1 Tax=Rhodococcus sp. HS-D2 TaxID=1384636 RepID=UPI0007D9A8C0|nr:hypothetical protein [Rhodococcus sp. HS-D2]